MRSRKFRKPKTTQIKRLDRKHSNDLIERKEEDDARGRKNLQGKRERRERRRE